jgi:hypothetical protein
MKGLEALYSRCRFFFSLTLLEFKNPDWEIVSPGIWPAQGPREL